MPYHHLTHDDRFTLATLLRTGMSQKDIAQHLGVHPSTVSRELGRRTTPNRCGYDLRVAQRHANDQRLHANQRFRRLAQNQILRAHVVSKLTQYWSPQQIAGHLARTAHITLAHETIYQFIYTTRPDLIRFLRHKKNKYRRRHGSILRATTREDAKKRRIDTRPEMVTQRSRIGDWEGDTIVGHEKIVRILTHVERKSGYLLADKLAIVSAAGVHETTTHRFQRVPRNKRYTITYDNGSEFAAHEMTERRTRITIYFAFPYHSWERGTNENTNGLLRQFFPKRSLFATITPSQLAHCVSLINHRPRKRLGYRTPFEVFWGRE